MKKTACILVVDDEEEFRKALATFLTDKGFDVLTAGDGSEALQQIISRDIDVVLLDLQIPKVHGFEVLDHLQRNHPSVKVVVITGYYDEIHVVKALARGAHKVFSKPGDFMVVLEMIRDLLKDRA